MGPTGSDPVLSLTPSPHPESPREAHSRLTHDNGQHNLYLDVNKTHFKKEIRISTDKFIITWMNQRIHEPKNLMNQMN